MHDLVPRSLMRRDVATDAGNSLKRWVASWTPASAFVVAICACFFCFCVLTAIVWETIRICRARVLRRDEEQWYQRPDGSSVLIPGGRGGRQAQGGTYLGPMGSLVREGRADRNGQGYGYVPAHHGSTPREMLGQANSMSGRFEAYDPPPVQMQPQGPTRYQLVDGPYQEERQGRFPPMAGGTRPVSVGTMETAWSGDTRIGTGEVGKKSIDMQATGADFGKNETPLFLPYQPPPPSTQPSPVPSNLTAARPHTVPAQEPPSVVGSFDSGRTLPLPNSPRTPRTSTGGPGPSPLSGTVAGESAFSTPKPAVTPSATLSTGPSPAPPPSHGRTQSIPSARTGFVPSHTRGQSSGGFQPKPFGLSSSPPQANAAGGIGRSTSLGSSITTPEPPKVDLKRTWSIGTMTWGMPGLKSSSERKDGKEGLEGTAEDEARLVSQ
ncbi:hypothetical protein JCM11251_007794 [Rhodosporidiobolus azoricus]